MVRSTLLCVVLLATGVTCSRTDPAQLAEARAANREGVQRLQASQVLQAIERFEQARKLDPDNAEYPNNLGMAYLQLGQAARAAELFRAARELNDDEPIYAINLGSACLQQGDFECAEGALEQATELNPRSFIAYKLLGEARFKLARYEPAAQAFEAAAELAPDEALLNQAALIYRDLDNLERAEELLKKANGLPGSSAASAFNLGELLQRQKRFAEAEALFRTAIQRSPDGPVAYLNLALTQAEQGQYEAAFQSLDAYLQRLPPTEAGLRADAKRFRETWRQKAN